MRKLCYFWFLDIILKILYWRKYYTGENMNRKIWIRKIWAFLGKDTFFARVMEEDEVWCKML